MPPCSAPQRQPLTTITRPLHVCHHRRANSARVQDDPASPPRQPSDAPPCVCLPTFFWDAAAGACRPCPRHAQCVNGEVFSSPGYWRPSAGDTRLVACRPGRCLDEYTAQIAAENPAVANDTEALQALVDALELRVPAQRRTAGAACAEGFTGPLCGVCAQGWSFQGPECVRCRPEEAFLSWQWWQVLLLVALVAFFLLGLATKLFVLVLFPEVQVR